jgi:hypothetical protein
MLKRQASQELELASLVPDRYVPSNHHKWLKKAMPTDNIAHKPAC